jgi:hypothetical protein
MILGASDVLSAKLRGDLILRLQTSHVVGECTLAQEQWLAPQSYRQESGSSLRPWLIWIQAREPGWGLAKDKLIAQYLEDIYSRVSGKRRLNINPGQLCANGISLASHKPGPFRSQIADGVWSEQQFLSTATELSALPNAFSEYLLPSIFRSLKRRVLLHSVDVPTTGEAPTPIPAYCSPQSEKDYQFPVVEM